MNKKSKIIFIIILIITIISFITISYGFEINDLKGKQEETETFKNTGNSIVRIISTIGVVVSVVMLIIIGIKYMMGSIEEKAEYKKTLLPYVVGSGLVFAASSIAQIIYNIAIKL